MTRATLLTRLVSGPLPSRAKRAAAQCLVDVFARAFCVDAPRLAAVTHAEDHNPATSALSQQRPDLWAFRSFSEACIQQALAFPDSVPHWQEALYREAFALGSYIRNLLSPTETEFADLVCALYALIGIDVSASDADSFVFHRCYFSGGYTPEVCAFMSFFDSGFVGGLAGEGRLLFTSRITQGAPCCIAHLVTKEVLS